MSRTLHNIKLGLDEDLAEQLKWLAPGYAHYRILRQSVDARKRHSPHFVYSVEVFDTHESPEKTPIEVEKIKYSGRPVVILGAGPAGLFAALRLTERGIRCILLEQGSETATRVQAIAKFWRKGELNPMNNVGFGEGGAGLFSDGKLITRIKSPFIPYVMQRLVKFGAPAEIEYLANPHVGSDRIRRVIPVMREYLRDQGAEIRFNCKVSEILNENKKVTGVKTQSGEVIHCDDLILACGHSAEDLFKHLHEIGVFMEGKSFAVGLRIEHPQSLINQLQYREFSEHPKLGSANYKLAHHNDETNVGVYSFCMCPGGYVLSSSTDTEGVVANGMSNFNRNSPFANAAIVVSVDHKSNFSKDLFGGMKFRKELEAQGLRQVIEAGGSKELPAQKLMDFLNEKTSPVEKTSCPSGVIPTRLDQIFKGAMREAFIKGLQKFEEQMPGFMGPEAVLHGVESRTSCPLRITRNEMTLESVSHSGLYPTGEGAGYAGGITSAACDGIKVVEAIVAKVHSQAKSSAELQFPPR